MVFIVVHIPADELEANGVEEIGGELMLVDAFVTVPATVSSIEALEKVVVLDDGGGGGGGVSGSVDQCAICFEELVGGSVASRMPCSHVYHGDCIQTLSLSQVFVRHHHYRLVSICSGGGDRNIACNHFKPGPTAKDQPLDDGDEKLPDLPQLLESLPESFRGTEFDWFDPNAFYERKDLSKGNNNSNKSRSSITDKVFVLVIFGFVGGNQARRGRDHLHHSRRTPLWKGTTVQ
ncbi:hypothetical protein RHGRI_024177 [Rhododendron griersonianum]|uniref:RING-type E3 ubiquitin transferase n=1 Tax=Rhododendron griersonianum TaxID=479676 RepID=A0AAV6JAI7_9ERIC|nr:hypothetical protein RHGRI_024177 [Rhododendron griersonianum]